MLFLLFLPFILPFLLLRFVFRALFGLVMLPFVLIMGALAMAIAVFAGVLAVSFAILLPLAPFALVGFCVWLLFRHMARPAMGHPLG